METTGSAAPPPRRALDKLESGFVAANRWVLIILLAVMAALVIGNVITRYVFGHSFSWVEEVTRYMMIWAAFLGAGPALRVGGHIAVDTLPGLLPPRGARMLRVLVMAIVAATLVLLLVLGIEYARFGWEQESPVLSLSLGKVYLAIPAGAALMLAHLGLVARRYVGSGEWERVEGFDPQAL